MLNYALQALSRTGSVEGRGLKIAPSEISETVQRTEKRETALRREIKRKYSNHF